MAADHDALAQRRMSHWSQQHDGYDLRRSHAVRLWLRAMDQIAGPLARAGIAPTAVTLAGIGAAVAAVNAAAAGPPATVSAGLVLATAVCDGLDGAVARHRAETGRPCSRYGEAIDHAADRITDVLVAAALARAGAPSRVATAAAVATLGYEGLRAVLRRQGRVDALVTIGERPMRIAAVVAGLMAAPATGAAIVTVVAAGAAAQTVRHSGDRAGRATPVN